MRGDVTGWCGKDLQVSAECMRGGREEGTRGVSKTRGDKGAA